LRAFFFLHFYLTNYKSGYIGVRFVRAHKDFWVVVVVSRGVVLKRRRRRRRRAMHHHRHHHSRAPPPPPPPSPRPPKTPAPDDDDASAQRTIDPTTRLPSPRKGALFAAPLLIKKPCAKFFSIQCVFLSSSSLLSSSSSRVLLKLSERRTRVCIDFLFPLCRERDVSTGQNNRNFN
jgi:hypothetical protein